MKKNCILRLLIRDLICFQNCNKCTKIIVVPFIVALLKKANIPINYGMRVHAIFSNHWAVAFPVNPISQEVVDGYGMFLTNGSANV